MKRTLPVIIALMSLSLLGLIFFQFIWLKTAKQTKQQQLTDNIYITAVESSESLMDIVMQRQQLEIGQGGSLEDERVKAHLFNSSVMQTLKPDQISSIIRKTMDKHALTNVSFEFAITDASPTGISVSSKHFDNLFLDSTNNTRYAVELNPPAGSNLENITMKEYLILIVPNQDEIVFKEILWFIMGTVAFTVIIIAAFWISIVTVLRQKKLSEIKSDFINNMTHEFKTPIATISLAVDALKNKKVIEDEEKTAFYTQIIRDENKRMNMQVETILQASLLEKNQIEMEFRKFSAHALMNKAIDNIRLPLQEKNGTLDVSLRASNDLVMADEVHFINIINNLLDNGLKYSKDEGVSLAIATENTGKNLIIRITDNGIGMNRETLSRIFEKFYRAHTGNLHNVKGFGLGLSYVKSIVEAHHGNIKAESTLGKGSTFTITLPLIQQQTN
jgi:two-component system phosphate regulon sensor histidine kinase PhoR